MSSASIAPVGHDLETLTRMAVAHQAGVPLRAIRSQPNKDKYHDVTTPIATSDSLTEIFYLMRSLNERAVEDSRIGSDSRGWWSFRDVLNRHATDIADAMYGREFTYVELGPEPVKTTYLINRLRAFGVRIARYIGVDINPASVEPMRKCLSELLDPMQIESRICDFADLTAEDIHPTSSPSLVTMFGFQEGNEHPGVMAERLNAILRSGDLVASEMQVADHGDLHKLRTFYDTPEMRRFSRLTFERMIGSVPSTYRIFTPWLDLRLGSPVVACVTAEQFRDAGSGRSSICLTNWCLKLSSAQLRLARERDASLHVTAERRTGDRSVLFQLAEAAETPVSTPAHEPLAVMA